ncbi:hypothetical protein [Thermocatellispora tengchongensis]|uniref:hypothetical protein n=1 Tax=Thermocatellispora tengchongensis TaxID=1073253 RepID=UPI003640AD3D
MAATNAFARAGSCAPTTATGTWCGVGAAIAYVYEPANSPAAAVRMNISTVAGRNGERRNASQRPRTAARPSCARSSMAAR